MEYLQEIWRTNDPVTNTAHKQRSARKSRANFFLLDFVLISIQQIE